MADEYTPTTSKVRGVWSAFVNYGGIADAPSFLSTDEALAAFDRWLAAHDREVAAKALRDAADEMRAEYEERTAKVGSYGQTKIRAALLTASGMCSNRADRIERGA